MRKSPPRPQVRRPSDRLRIGDFVVDLSLREIVPSQGGEPVRITLKSMGVLLALVDRAGSVVSREALLEQVWSDTLPCEDVVTQAVTQLRKVFGDSRARTAYIDTISKHGYRLIAPVEWLPEIDAAPVEPANADSPEARQSPRSESPGRMVRAAVALAIAVAVVLGGWWVFGAPDVDLRVVPPATSAGQAVVEYERIASLPEAERGQSLSPDGAMVAYSRTNMSGDSAALMVQTSAPLQPRVLTGFVPGRHDTRPAWSPDGRSIAFVRFVATRSRCTIMLIPVVGGSERELGPCIGPDLEAIRWYPDGKTLIGAGRPGDRRHAHEGSSIHRMSLSKGHWERVSYSRATTDIDKYPAVSPDGRWIAFHRNLSIGDLWRMPIDGGTPQRLTRLQFQADGLAWMPDSRRLLFSRDGNGKKILSLLDIANGALSDFSVAGSHLSFPSVAQKRDAIAFQIVDTRDRILRLNLASGTTAFSTAQTVVESNGANRLPALSPDDRELVFASDRSGQPLLWWLDLGEPASLRPIEGFVPRLDYPPDWDAASRRVIAVGRGAQGEGIYEIEPRSGRIVHLPSPETDAVQVVFHPDPSRLLVLGGAEQGRLGLTLYDRSTRPWRRLARIDSGVNVVVVDHVRRRILFGRRATPDVMQADLDLRNVRDAGKLHDPRRNRTLAPAADGVWAMDVSPRCNWYWRRVTVGDAERAGDGMCLGHQDPRPLDAVLGFDESRGDVFLSSLEFESYDIGYLPSTAAFTTAR